MQRALMQWKRPEKRPLVREALHRTHREDLIGFGKECLLRPEKYHRQQEEARPIPRKNRRETGKGGEKITGKQVRPARKAGWAVAKPKKNARPGKKRGK